MPLVTRPPDPIQSELDGFGDETPFGGGLSVAPASAGSNGRVVVIRTPQTNIKPDRKRMAELGQRGLTIRSGLSAKRGNPVTVTLDDLTKMAQQGQWLGDAERLTEEQVKATPINAARRPVAKTAAAPVRQPVRSPAPQRGPQPIRTGVQAPQDQEFEQEMANVPPEDNSLQEDRISALEHELHRLQAERQAEPTPGEDFPWVNTDGSVRRAECPIQFSAGGFSTQTYFHGIIYDRENAFVVLITDSRDTVSPRSFPSQVGSKFEVTLETEQGVITFNAGHVGLQFSIGVLDLMVLCIVPEQPDTGEADEPAGEQPAQGG